MSSPVNAAGRYPGGHDIKRIWESTDASMTGSAVGLNQQDLDSDEVYFRRRTRTQHTPEYHPSEAMQSRVRKTRSVTLESMDIGHLSQSLMGLNMNGHVHGGLSPHASRLSHGGNCSYPTAANTPTGMQSPVHPLSSSFDHQRSQSWLENQDSNGSFAVPASLPSFNKTPIPSPIRSGPSTPRVSRALNINTTLANSAFGPKDSFLPSPASVSDPFSPHSAFSPWVQTPSARSGLASTPTSPGKWNLLPKAEEIEVAKKVDTKNGDSQQGYSYF
ncbi:hypothetical protein BKA69DRAFT_659727 [Paraphysoderma sedebokerense]|nr:hypothetical protein BKA69DRAFT_659727 [Paraphysoderma sedebokerense]